MAVSPTKLSSPTYRNSISSTPLSIRSGLTNGVSSLSPHSSPIQPLLQTDDEPVRMHPLIISGELVVCMPEVNKVLRNVYQVLSQANYYLSKHGISSRRFTGAQLIKIKMLGILNHDAKVCSYILQAEAERIFDSFDLSGSCRKSHKIIWNDPILLDEGPMNPTSNGTGSRGWTSRENSEAPVVDIQPLLLGQDIIVCAPDIQKVIQTHFNQGATIGYYFSKFGIVPYKFVLSEHLDKVKGLGIIKKSAVHCTYVARRDAERVFEAYGMTEEDIQHKKIKWLDPVELSDTSGYDLPTQESSLRIKSEHPFSPDSKDGDDDETVGSNEDNASDSFLYIKSDSIASMRVHILIVEGKEVVCMPDIHKVVQHAHGNSIQVNYYLNKLRVKKKRFCFAHLKELKSRNIVQGNATYCTYVPKVEAEKIFQIYSLMGDEKISHVEWSDPIKLDQDHFKQENGDANGDLVGSGHGHGDNGEEKLRIHTFAVDKDIVICTPDVHKVVDFLEEQSASLDYHFRKLGIMKHRYTYSQLHQLRRLQVIKRPTVCTFVSKSDVERLLQMYATDRNRCKMQNIHFLDPISLVASDHGPHPAPDSPVESQAVTSLPTHCRTHSPPTSHIHQQHNTTHSHTNTPVGNANTPNEDYAISDLYKVFVGDRSENRENTCHSPKHSHALPLNGSHPVSSPTTSAAMKIQEANPHIDCPIVIPSGDFDPSKVTGSPIMLPLSRDSSKRSLESNEDSSAKRSRTEVHERLLKDLSRKETELRVLHEAYQREIEMEREKRIRAERDLSMIRDSHVEEIRKMSTKHSQVEEEMKQLSEELSIERQMRERLERDVSRLGGGQESP